MATRYFRQDESSPVTYDHKHLPSGRILMPLFGKVVIRRDEAPEKAGVLWIPQMVRDAQPVLSGTIVAVGPDTRFLFPGDYVVFSQYAGSMVKVDGLAYAVMKEEDVHVVIRSEE